MTNKPENKTIEQIRDELAESVAILPSYANKSSYSIEWNTQVKNNFKAGFDARGKIEEERTDKLVKALEVYAQNQWQGSLAKRALKEFKGEK